MMELLLNERSLHGQFHDINELRRAIETVMTMRSLAKKFGFQLHSHRSILTRHATPTQNLIQAVNMLPKDQRRSVLMWSTREGPFWEDSRNHSPDDWMIHNDDVVTDSSIGEAAYCISIGISQSLVSFDPSSWKFSPIHVWNETNTETHIPVPNYWDIPGLETALTAARPTLSTWRQLEVESIAMYPMLSFLPNCFNHLEGHPFSSSAAKRIFSLLGILNKLMVTRDSAGRYSDEGNRLYQEYFTGHRALFSNSSDTDIQRFGRKMRFAHPDKPGAELSCPWHGKINTPVLRIHFAWPESSSRRAYIAYIGRKIALK